MTNGEERMAETPLGDGLTWQEKQLILALLEHQVRGSRLLARTDGDEVYHVFCGGCGHSAPRPGDITHARLCAEAGVWALYDKLSRLWEEEETPPPAPAAGPACG